jgi:hypothetical protein
MRKIYKTITVDEMLAKLEKQLRRQRVWVKRYFSDDVEEKFHLAEVVTAKQKQEQNNYVNEPGYTSQNRSN